MEILSWARGICRLRLFGWALGGGLAKLVGKIDMAAGVVEPADVFLDGGVHDFLNWSIFISKLLLECLDQTFQTLQN